MKTARLLALAALGVVILPPAVTWADDRHPIKEPEPRAEASAEADADANATAEAFAEAAADATATADGVNTLTVEALAQVSAQFGMGHSGDSGWPTAGCYYPSAPGRSLPMFGRSAKYARDEDCVCREVAALYVGAGRGDLAVRQLALCGGLAEVATTTPLESSAELYVAPAPVESASSSDALQRCEERVERAEAACIEGK